ncbi:stalk domain-containing protein [Paenibacillus spongiae]|uniref:Phosphodiester glycosidase family protein n=1 Tax=Paenibacillus spongiae TaxID=2909671 RepID=A0ABY5SBL1_9BACL|nr:stalk domain-containing protein [Paenibacillus spongiae]UVI29910.1 phosphodiester glycosidase family protein [Paenibacillus spongiae]
MDNGRFTQAQSRRRETRKANKKAKRNVQKLLVITLGAALLVQPISLAIPLSTAAAAEAVQQQLFKQNEEMITSGAKRIDYKWTKSKGGYSNVHVIEIDLTNPYVKLDVMSGKQGLATGLGSVGSMVKNSGAVAGVNADFFNTSGKGSTLGAQVTSGMLVASPSQLKGMYAFAVTNERKPMIDLFSFDGTVISGDGASFPLAGINKAAYRTEPGDGYSHSNAMYIYTSAWTASRPTVADSATTPTEVLVVDGVVQQIVENGTIPGTPPANGYILRTHGKAAVFALEHLQIGQSVNATYALTAQTTGQKVDPASLQMLVGGHTILVDQGKTTAFSRDTSGISGAYERSRTAVGYTQDSGKVMLITVEDVGSSEGMTLAELQKMMVKLGVWRGINLDGGGSTTMITRPLGEVETGLAHPTENGSQRGVANGIGVFTTAPQGQLRGITASGSTELFVGQQASYQLKGYDTYYNPIDPGSLTPVWKAEGGAGAFSGNVFTASKPGKATITVKAGDISDKLAVEVIGGEQIARMSIDASSPVLEQGKTISVPVSVTLNDGRKLQLPASSVKWELRGFSGTVKDGALTIGAVAPGAKAGYAIARYDGFSAVTVLATGADKKFEDFEAPTYSIKYEGTNNVVGNVGLVTGLTASNASQALQLNYDFTGATGTKVAYAVLNGSGRQVEGSPSAMTLDVLGDESLNWLRAEFIDKNGKAHLVTLADKVTWSGWKQLKVNLPSDKMAYPITLKRLYIASIEEGQDERALSGSIAFDNITFQYPALVPEPARQSILLTIGSKSAKVGGKSYTLEAAPIALEGTTYLPLRFVTEAMGAQVDWDQKLQRVTVLRGSSLMEMWLGKKSFILNGTKMDSEVAPIARSGRTLVPIRLVSEQLGLTVNWDSKTDQITVQ